ncbi:DUF3263 domain-containing protein [Nocardioides daejeonensis]|uniref:DUF3263 domain-containing protein n=1 Tax=Nocardioides daejeonensis TaxID=1046556 RepID=UPI003B84854B
MNGRLDRAEAEEPMLVRRMRRVRDGRRKGRSLIFRCAQSVSTPVPPAASSGSS